MDKTTLIFFIKDYSMPSKKYSTSDTLTNMHELEK